MDSIGELADGTGVIVALIDTGCSMDHPDLAGTFWENRAEANGTEGVDDDGNGYIDDVNGYDFVSAAAAIAESGEDVFPPDSDPEDTDGHGTHAAGIISAKTGNGIGIEGMAPNAELMILRAGFRSPEGRSILLEEDIVEAIEYAVEMGADIIHMPFGGRDTTLHGAVRSAYRAGITMVAAAGNTESREPVYPAAFKEVTAVTASGADDRPAVFAAAAEWVDCMAPGVSIISCSPSGYSERNGSSCAASFVTGCAALIRSKNRNFGPALTAAQIVQTGEKITYEQSADAAFPLCSAYRAVSSEPGIVMVPSVESAVLTEVEGSGSARAHVVVSVRNGWKELGECLLGIESTDEHTEVNSSFLRLDRFRTGESSTLGFDITAPVDSFYSSGADAAVSVITEREEASFEFSTVLIRPEVSAERVFIREKEGDGDGGADPGERVFIELELVNGIGKQQDVSGKIISGDVEAPDSVSLSLPPYGRQPVSFEVEIPGDSRPGSALKLPLMLKCGTSVKTEFLPLWISYRRDGSAVTPAEHAGHTSYYPDAEGRVDRVLWKKPFFEEGRGSCRPAVYRNRVIIFREEGGGSVLYGLDAVDGEMIWKSRLGKKGGSAPGALCQAHGICFVACGEVLTAVDCGTGIPVWSYPAPVENRDQMRDPVFEGGVIVLFSSETDDPDTGLAEGLNPLTGKPVWQRSLPFVPAVTPTCSAGRVFAASADGRIIALEIRSGEYLWDSVKAGVVSFPPAADGELLFVPLTSGELLTIDCRSGEWLHRTEITGVPVGISLATGMGGRLTVLSRIPGGALLTGVEPETGIVDREFRINGFSGTSVIGCGDQVLAVGYGGRYIRAGRDLTEQGSFSVPELQNTDCSEPVVIGNSLFILFNGNGIDYAASFAAPGIREAVPACRPNPFNPSTEITFSLNAERRVRLIVFDAAGRLVSRLADRVMAAGEHTVNWNGRDTAGAAVASGVYFCRLDTGRGSGSVKLVLIR